ncbi:universal stress protein [Nocardioides luteus]|uniref:universal stress protein n=1 Tax=Nocardioides luteus TaxID=1844 RepID=UPI0018C95C64|nr:universal stress protein [Nocardioides luteus]MBG6096974.1 nucleotide-binding universal stress UspA family protein [Nocardioides luteus]
MRSDGSSQAASELERRAATVWAVDVFLDHDESTVHAVAKLFADGRPALVGTGAAGLCPGQDRTVGERLAASRALERLAAGLLTDARREVDEPEPPGREGSARRARPLRSAPRMLVGTDRPLRRTPAIDWAVAHTEPGGLGVELCHVVDDAGPSWERTLRGSVSEAEEEMAELVDAVRQEHPSTSLTSSVLVGSESALLARSRDRELVVIGRADVDGGDGAYVGATAMTIAQNAEVPIVVVPSGWSPHPDAEGPVMVAIDALEPHLEAVEFALAYAHWRGLPLLAVAAWDTPATSGTPMLLNSEEEWMERIADGLDAAVGPLRALYPDVAVSQRSPHGPPAEVILGLAERASLLVVGRPGHGRHWRMPLGSVSRRLLHRATVPVAVVPTDWHALSSAMPRHLPS